VPEGSYPPRAPSDPKPLPSRRGADGGSDSGPLASLAWLPAIIVGVLGILLVAVPLYLWRRPRATLAPVGDAGTAENDALDASLGGIDIVDSGPDAGIRLSDPRVLECYDSSSKKTPTEQCDSLPEVAKSLDDAVLAAKDCLPLSAGSGSITYVAEVSFSKRHMQVGVSVPKSGRSYKGMKLVGGCAASVRSALSGLSLEGMAHKHTHYKIAVVASYPGRTPSD
jgi:hypothetical protein